MKAFLRARGIEANPDWSLADYLILAALLSLAATANTVWWISDRLHDLKEKRKP